MIKFVYERPSIHDEFSAVKTVTMEVDDERSLDEMLDAYKEFLQSIGFSVTGDIVVQPYES